MLFMNASYIESAIDLGQRASAAHVVFVVAELFSTKAIATLAWKVIGAWKSVEKVALDAVGTTSPRKVDAAVDRLIRCDGSALLEPCELCLEGDIGLGVSGVTSNVASRFTLSLLCFVLFPIDAGIVFIPDVEGACGFGTGAESLSDGVEPGECDLFALYLTVTRLPYCPNR